MTARHAPFFFCGPNNKKKMAEWITNLTTAAPTQPGYFGKHHVERTLTALKGGNGQSIALIGSVVVSVVGTFFVFIMLRPPIVMRQNHPHEAPKINISRVVVWSLAAGGVTTFLSLVG